MTNVHMFIGDDIKQDACVICGKLYTHSWHDVPNNYAPEKKLMDEEKQRLAELIQQGISNKEGAKGKRVPICAWCETEFPGTHLPGSTMLRNHRCDTMITAVKRIAEERYGLDTAPNSHSYRELGVGNYYGQPVKFYVKEDSARRIKDGEADPEKLLDTTWKEIRLAPR